jgi:hypothetical protein
MTVWVAAVHRQFDMIAGAPWESNKDDSQRCHKAREHKDRDGQYDHDDFRSAGLRHVSLSCAHGTDQGGGG